MGVAEVHPEKLWLVIFEGVDDARDLLGRKFAGQNHVEFIFDQLPVDQLIFMTFLGREIRIVITALRPGQSRT